MAKLELCFKDKGTGQQPLTESEINDIAIAAQGVQAIVRAMYSYAVDDKGKGLELGIYTRVFNVLDWLMEPVNDYLYEYAGNEAAEENEPENKGEAD